MTGGELLGYLFAYGSGVVSTCIVWQLVNWRREVRQFRAWQERDDAWDREHGLSELRSKL